MAPGVSDATLRKPLGTECHGNYLAVSRFSAGAHEGDSSSVQSAGHGSETTGRHRRVEAPPAPTNTARHRAVTIPPADQRPAPAPIRRRHAAASAPSPPPDAVTRPRSRAPRRVLVGVALFAVALGPVLA